MREYKTKITILSGDYNFVYGRVVDEAGKIVMSKTFGYGFLSSFESAIKRAQKWADRVATFLNKYEGNIN